MQKIQTAAAEFIRRVYGDASPANWEAGVMIGRVKLVLTDPEADVVEVLAFTCSQADRVAGHDSYAMSVICSLASALGVTLTAAPADRKDGNFLASFNFVLTDAELMTRRPI